MTHLGKAMARLNPRNVRFDTGSGPDSGGAAITPELVAGALGFVPAGLGRDLLEWRWWPDGAALSKVKLHTTLVGMLRAEWQMREEAFVTAVTAKRIAETPMAQSLATLKYARARRRRWPSLIVRRGDEHQISDTYLGIVRGVLAEIRNNGRCDPCGGSGHVSNAGIPSPCKRCSGLGVSIPSDRTRADACGLKSHRDFAVLWEPVYLWLLGQAEDAVAPADDEMQRQLR